MAKATPKAKKPAAVAKAKSAKPKAQPPSKAPKGKPKATAPPASNVSALEAEIAEHRATEGMLRAELETVRAHLADIEAQLHVTQTELKLAQATAKERVDAGWASQTAEQELSAAQDAVRKADRAAEASRAEAAVLRSEIDRLRGQLHGKDTRPPTLPGLGGAPKPAPSENREEGAPQKAMPQDETAKNVADDKPSFWGRLFKGKKDEST
jgi:hypothetical protein